MPKPIHKQLTLKLEPSTRFVHLDDFVRAIGLFQKAVKALSADSPKVDWIVSELKEGSAVASVQPVGDDDAGERAVLLGSSALEALDAGGALPSGVPDDFLEGIHELGEFSIKRKIKTTVSNGRGRVVLSRKLVDHLEEYREVGSSEEFGAVEGRLEGINIHGSYQCHVYTDLGAQKVAVEFGKDELDHVKAGLGARVSVRGTITYSKQGRPLRVDDAKIHRFAADDELPSIDDMMGVAPGISDGLPAEQYLRSLRESDGE